MTFKFLSHVAGQQITTSTTSTSTAFATDGSQPTLNNALRVQNIDATNGVFFITGDGTETATDHCHYVGPNSYLDVKKRDTDTHVSLKAVAGTPKVNLHFGHCGTAD
jgi:hypothetical protein